MMKSKRFWQFKASVDGKSADLLLYGPISDTTWLGDEVTPKQFAEDLRALGDIDQLNVYINSVGGDVFAGQAIHSMLKRHKAYVNVYIDGIAASIASVVAMAGDTIIMPKNAMMMIHNPWTIALGDSEELREVADTLDKIRESIVAAYQEKSGLDREDIIELMNDETWFTAEEAVEWGFADQVEESKTVAASVDGKMLVVGGLKFDISRFEKFPGDRVPKAHGKEVNEVELTVEILAEKYPEIHAAVKKAGYEEGVQAERARMKAIDELAVPGAEEIINRAKYETGASAEAVAMEIIKAEKEKRNSYLAKVRADAEDVNDVKPSAAPTGEKNQAELEMIKSAFAKGANSKRK